MDITIVNRSAAVATRTPTNALAIRSTRLHRRFAGIAEGERGTLEWFPGTMCSVLDAAKTPRTAAAFQSITPLPVPVNSSSPDSK